MEVFKAILPTKNRERSRERPRLVKGEGQNIGSKRITPCSEKEHGTHRRRASNLGRQHIHPHSPCTRRIHLVSKLRTLLACNTGIFTLRLDAAFAAIDCLQLELFLCLPQIFLGPKTKPKCYSVRALNWENWRGPTYRRILRRPSPFRSALEPTRQVPASRHVYKRKMIAQDAAATWL